MYVYILYIDKASEEKINICNLKKFCFFIYIYIYIKCLFLICIYIYIYINIL